MRIVQLGLFQDALDYVYENILDPVWVFVSGLITSGFEYLSRILPAAIEAVMGSIIGEVIGRILDWYYMKWFHIQAAILLLLDCLEDCFNVVSGLRPVYVSGEKSGTPMLFAVFNQRSVQYAFYAMILVGFVICFAMAIVATARNFFELGGEKTKPVTHIIKMTAKSFLYLALAPLLASALIMMSQAVLNTMDKAMTEGNGKTSIARIIFCIASLDAVDTTINSDGKEYNVSYTEGPSKASLTDKYRKEYYYEDDHLILPNYTNFVKVIKTFQIHAFDYFIGIGCGIFFTVVMCMILAVFIGRIFDVIVLLVIQPFFVGMMPFDDGEYYKKWFELFLGKLFQGFGSVIAMKLYLMILEQLFAGSISFTNSKTLGARLQDYLMMLIFAMGGAVAVRHVGPLVTGILSQTAATGEQMSAAAGWKVGEAIANKEANFVKGQALKPLGKMGKMAGGAFGSMMRGRGGAAIGGRSVADGIGKFESKMRPRATSLGGNLTDEKSHSAEQKSLENMKASVLGGGLDKATQARNRYLPKSVKGNSSDEGVSFKAESRSLDKMRGDILGEIPQELKASGNGRAGIGANGGSGSNGLGINNRLGGAGSNGLGGNDQFGANNGLRGIDPAGRNSNNIGNHRPGGGAQPPLQGNMGGGRPPLQGNMGGGRPPLQGNIGRDRPPVQKNDGGIDGGNIRMDDIVGNRPLGGGNPDNNLNGGFGANGGNHRPEGGAQPPLQGNMGGGRAPIHRNNGGVNGGNMRMQDILQDRPLGGGNPENDLNGGFGDNIENHRPEGGAQPPLQGNMGGGRAPIHRDNGGVNGGNMRMQDILQDRPLGGGNLNNDLNGGFGDNGGNHRPEHDIQPPLQENMGGGAPPLQQDIGGGAPPLQQNMGGGAPPPQQNMGDGNMRMQDIVGMNDPLNPENDNDPLNMGFLDDDPHDQGIFDDYKR